MAEKIFLLDLCYSWVNLFYKITHSHLLYDLILISEVFLYPMYTQTLILIFNKNCKLKIYSQNS